MHLSRSFHRRGFTLTELLVVLAIIAILSSLAAPVLSSILRTYQLESAGQTIINQLNLARQTALSRGHAVQVRFYLLPDYNAASNGTPTVYRGMQSFIELDPVQSASETTSTSAITKAAFFPAPTVISSVTTPSTVSPLLPASANVADPANPLPVYQSNYKYATFHFKPDGSTDLATGLNSLTLVLENDKASSSGLPANFQTITIDPLSGTIRSFRP